jgi:7-cyano-7-deazaguanine reductase
MGSTGELYGTVAIREKRLKSAQPQPREGVTRGGRTPSYLSVPAIGVPDFASHQCAISGGVDSGAESLKLNINSTGCGPLARGPANQILDDLVELLQPRWMRVTADFTVRGNIKTVVTAEHGCRERA